MAKNYVQAGKFINAAADDPATPACGDPVVVGTIPGVAVTKEGEGGNASGECTIATKGVFNLNVTGSDGTNPAAVAKGDKLYYDSGILNKNSSGTVLYGKALGTVDLGDPTALEDIIPVMLIQA